MHENYRFAYLVSGDPLRERQASLFPKEVCEPTGGNANSVSNIIQLDRPQFVLFDIRSCALQVPTVGKSQVGTLLGKVHGTVVECLHFGGLMQQRCAICVMWSSLYTNGVRKSFSKSSGPKVR
jgi:hypothetical protein